MQFRELQMNHVQKNKNLEMKRIHKLSAFKSLPSNPECGHQAIRVEVSVTVVTLLQLDLR